MECRTATLSVLAVGKLQPDIVDATLVTPTFGDLLLTPETVPGK